jgi:hypothetical protein
VTPVRVGALESGQLSGHCGLRVRIGGERRVAIDPERTYWTRSPLVSRRQLIDTPLVLFDRASEEPQRSEEQYCSAFKLKMGFDRNNPD